MKLVTMFLTLILLGGCASTIGSTEEQHPEIGRDRDDYKRSPCACLEVEQQYPEGWDDWLKGYGVT